ncbi:MULTISPECIES: hypothetical protein [Streptomyces]|uniref:Uncharacterized protein n=1 Tax=Streptomyces luteosporeus TaxID=173856 RepID=A0ABN3TS54_9ACTN
MVSTFGRARARALGALVLVLGVLLGTAQPGAAADLRAPRPRGAAEGTKVTYEDDAFARIGHEFRLSLSAANRRDAFDEWTNVAVALLDPGSLSRAQLTELLDLKPDRVGPVSTYTMVDLASMEDYMTADDYQRLKAKGVRQLLALRAMNLRGGSLHSEEYIKNRLNEHWRNRFRITEVPKALAWYSDRRPCRECAKIIEEDTPVTFAEEYDLTPAELAQQRRELSATDSITDNDARLAARKEINAKYKAQKDGRNSAAAAGLKKSFVRANDRVERRSAEINAKASSAFSATKPSCRPAKPEPRRSQAPGLPAQGFMRPVALVRGDVCPRQPSADAKPASGLGQALSLPGGAPGGIDFSSLELRYLSDPGDGSGLQYSFSAQRDPLKGDSRASTGLTVADQTSDAFFVWLALNPSAFWVNLNPNEPHRIVDAKLGRTDAGRIMLEADLQMKKSVGKLLHPDSETGRTFWDRISGSCMSQRVWILPSPATVRQDGDKLYIIDAPLDVRMETQYLAQKGQASAVSCAQQDKAAEKHNEELFRSLILPKLKEAINTGPEYADVRRVYLARVAAEWYRDLSRTRHTTYGDLIGKGDIDNWRTRTDWKPTDTFEKFVDSYTKGEFKVTHNTTSGDTTYVRTYTYGGVDLTRVPFTKVSGDRFRTEHAALSKDIDKSLTSPAAGEGDKAVWLGAPTPLQASGDAPDDGPSARRTALRLLPALLVPIAALLWWRRRRLSTSATASPLRRAAAPHRRNQ